MPGRYYNRILKLLAKYEPNSPTIVGELEARPWLELLLFEQKPRGH